MPRKAPKRPYDPLDEYSTWDIRIARLFEYCFIICGLILVIGVWATIINGLIETGKWEWYIALEASGQFFIVMLIIVGHLFLLVLFYIVFKGGKLRILKILFKDRLVAKKYEDHQSLRLLIGVTLVSVYLLIISLFVWIIPGPFFEATAEVWLAWASQLNVGGWILYIGVIILIWLLIIFSMFVLWNHGVYAVLKRVRRVEEEDEIKDTIKTEKLQKSSNEELKQAYRDETGRVPIYRGKETKGFIEWKQKKNL